MILMNATKLAMSILVSHNMSNYVNESLSTTPSTTTTTTTTNNNNNSNLTIKNLRISISTRPSKKKLFPDFEDYYQNNNDNDYNGLVLPIQDEYDTRYLLANSSSDTNSSSTLFALFSDDYDYSSSSSLFGNGSFSAKDLLSQLSAPFYYILFMFLIYILIVSVLFMSAIYSHRKKVGYRFSEFSDEDNDDDGDDLKQNEEDEKEEEEEEERNGSHYNHHIETIRILAQEQSAAESIAAANDSESVHESDDRRDASMQSTDFESDSAYHYCHSNNKNNNNWPSAKSTNETHTYTIESMLKYLSRKNNRCKFKPRRSQADAASCENCENAQLDQQQQQQQQQQQRALNYACSSCASTQPLLFNAAYQNEDETI